MVHRFSQLGWIISLAAVYALSGKAGLLLAIPPGYATAVWPPSGIAAAALLIGGLGLWPGVFLGSVLVNFWTSGDASSAEAIARSLMIAGGIGAGAALQAVLACALVRMALPHLNIFRLEAGVLRLLLLAGPVACVVNATIGVSTLFVAGLVPAEAFLFNWWTWWIGDSIGVLVFLPLLLIWRQRPYSEWWQRQLTVSTPTVMIFVAVVWLFFFASAREEGRIRREFEQTVAAAAANFDQALVATEQALDSLVSFYQAAPAVDAEGYRRFSEAILSAHPAILSLEFIQYADAPADTAEPLLLRRYSAPLTASTAGIGQPMELDAASRAAVDTARILGAMVSAPVQLQGSPQVLLRLFAPVAGAMHFDAQKYFRDNTQVSGFMLATVKIDEITWRSLRALQQSGIHYQLRYRLPGKPELVAAQSDDNSQRVRTALEQSVLIERGKQVFRLSFSISEEYLVEHRSWQAWGLLAVGLIFTALLCTVMLVLIGREARVEEIVASKTSQLRQQQNQASQLIASLPDPLLVIEESGRVLMVNDSALRVLGIPRAEVINHPASDFFAGDLWAHIRYSLDASGSEPPGPIRLRRADGRIAEVQIAASVFRNQDQQNYTVCVRGQERN